MEPVRFGVVELFSRWCRRSCRSVPATRSRGRAPDHVVENLSSDSRAVEQLGGKAGVGEVRERSLQIGLRGRPCLGVRWGESRIGGQKSTSPFGIVLPENDVQSSTPALPSFQVGPEAAGENDWRALPLARGVQLLHVDVRVRTRRIPLVPDTAQEVTGLHTFAERRRNLVSPGPTTPSSKFGVVGRRRVHDAFRVRTERCRYRSRGGVRIEARRFHHRA